MTRFTFDGFDFEKLVHGEKDNIKLVITGLGGIATFLATGINNPALNVAVSSVVAGLISLALSAFDYYQAE